MSIKALELGVQPSAPASPSSGKRKLFLNAQGKLCYKDHDGSVVQVGTTSYSDLSNVPASFPPSAHTHSYEELTSGPAEQGRVIAADGVGGFDLIELDAAAASYAVKSAPYTATAGDKIAADTSGGPWTLTLPSNPTAGDVIEVLDYGGQFASKSLIIARNGRKIESLNEDLTCNVSGSSFFLVFAGTTKGWQVVTTYSGGEGGGGPVEWSEILNIPSSFPPDPHYHVAADISDFASAVEAVTHATRHEAGNEDELQATAALVATDVVALNGVYFWDGTTTGGRPNFFKTGTRKNTKLQYDSSTMRWNLVRNLTIEAESSEDAYNEPWGQGWIPIGTPTTVSVTRLPLETMVQKLAETGGAATATTSEDGLMSSSDKTKLNGIAAGAEVNVQSNWTEADSGSDAFILNKPSTFAPSAHSSSHSVSGSDPLAPSDIGAQSIFVNENITSGQTLTAQRARIYTVLNFGSAYVLTLPSAASGSINGDVAVFFAATIATSVQIKAEGQGDAVGFPGT